MLGCMIVRQLLSHQFVKCCEFISVRSIKAYSPTIGSGTTFQALAFFKSVGKFVGIFVGSFAIGLALALITALISL